MTIDSLKTQISEVINSSGCSAEFYFLLDGNGGVKIKSVDIDQNDHSELERLFIKEIAENILANDDLSLLMLSGADERKNAIYKYDLEDIPPGLTHLKTILENEAFESFSFSNDKLAELEGILILIGNQNKQIALYKHHYPITLLKKGSGFSIIFGKDRFYKVDSDILKLNSKFEFFKFDDTYYIKDLKTLEKFFGFHEAVKNVAVKGIDTIKEADIIVDCSVLEERLDDISFSRKLVKSAGKSPVLGRIPNTQIISFTSTHPALKGKFKYSSDGNKIELKTKTSQNLFLKLLNDDFLQSELTKRYYDSIAKDNIETAED